MKLPNGDQAYISPAKLKDYLLSETHPIGRSKARFLRGVGFDETNVDLLEQRLLAIAANAEITEVVTTAYGKKYVVDGPLETPMSGQVAMRTVWIVEADEENPRFVTAYPASDGGEEE